MWKQTVRKLVVLPPRRRSAALWWAGGLLLLLLPAGYFGLGDVSKAITRGARILTILLGAGLLISLGWAFLARPYRNRE